MWCVIEQIVEQLDATVQLHDLYNNYCLVRAWSLAFVFSSSDLSVPITELVRMVKLYSTPWETKSAALKKLHEDYEK